MKIVNVRLKYGGQVMAYGCGDLNPILGDWVVAKNGDSSYLGQVVTAPVIVAPPKSRLAGRHLVRVAGEADIARQAENEVREREAFEYCLSRVAIQRLDMKLVAVEIVFDGSKTVFYYTADERVDFRLLVKELVSRFRTRIEMRQIGVRHEARMIGGLGTCGRGFCCAGFLANFAPVSVKMAKEQNISLSPSKISGVCGRLMCCLAFEHQGPLRPHLRGPNSPDDDVPVSEMNEEEIARLAAQPDD
jgi:cell fate regulator YaaT (PSP1 superfamily)